MSATTIHSIDTTTKARFLAPGTHQRADAEVKSTRKGKGQGALPSKGPTKTTKGRATEPAASVEDMYRPQLSARTAAGAMTVSTAP